MDGLQLRKMIRETHLAVVGDATIGVTGLVTRMNKVERRQRKWALHAVWLGGLVAGAALGAKEFIGAVKTVFGKLF